jgi:hypothetical protein
VSRVRVTMPAMASAVSTCSSRFIGVVAPDIAQELRVLP